VCHKEEDVKRICENEGNLECVKYNDKSMSYPCKRKVHHLGYNEG
jgi:hypothetical protein